MPCWSQLVAMGIEHSFVRSNAAGGLLYELMICLVPGFVGFSEPLNSVVVSHQGTDPTMLWAANSSNFLISHNHSGPVITDIRWTPAPLSPTLFPGIPPSATVHNGFAAAQAR